MPDIGMDLKRRLGLVSGGGQSYELIRSTQSLVDRLHLNSEEITIQPVHPSIMGQDNWFSITYTASNTTRYFSCQNARERDEWIASLRKTLTPTEDRRRTENSLKMWVFEVKGLSDKKKYFCEIHLDDKLYARTSSKKMAGMCFWGEYFNFVELPRVDRLTILIYKDKGAAKVGRRQRKPVGRVKISVASVLSRRDVEKWYPVEKSSRRECPSLRLKCQFQSIDILPLADYEPLLKCLTDDYRSLCRLLEPHISVKVKEELAQSLMSVFTIQDVAEDILADIVVHEIASNDNETLTFRGNSIATKAMEAYVKLVGEKYLEDTLRPTLLDILNSDLDLEVDPVKVGGGSGSADLLHSHRQDLRNVVTLVWKRIANSHSLFPVQLQRCFHKIRLYLEQVGKPEMACKLVSSCLFLRYLCPAILGPNLFHLTEEFPSERSNRNLTLIAKTLQSLANFARYEGKENSMEFMNGFLDEEMGNMRTFLQLVSSPPPEDWIQRLSLGDHRRGDLGRHLSNIHTILVENISKIPASVAGTSVTTISAATSCLETSSNSFNLEHLKTILNDINSNLHRPSTTTLDNIAEPTPVKIKRMSAEDKTTSTSTPASAAMSPANNSHHHHHHHMLGPLGSASTAPNSTSSTPVHHNSNNVISNWMSWTLGRGEKKAKVSHPIPQHELRNGGGSGGLLLLGGGGGKSSAAVPQASTFYTPDVTESSSSSASLTPSPKYAASAGSAGGGSSSGGGGGLWGSGQKSGIRKGSWKSASSISIIEDSDSESSSASSHYRGHQLQFSTLPRPRTETRTLSDYEREIHGLRSAMESLQVKLQEAERRLQQQQAASSASSDRSSSSAAATPPRQGSPNKEAMEYNNYHHHHLHYNNTAADDDVKEILARLLKEEDLLRRRIGGSGDGSGGRMGDKELMILLQQRKIAALDEANNRLVSELSRLGERSGGLSSTVHHHRSGNVAKRSVQETPKTVDELLDSFNDTPV